MSDLISRNALIEKLEEYIEYDSFDLYKEEPLINLSFEILEDIICSQPTAYDIDKVVEQLEEIFNSTDDRTMRLAYHHAIEILKKGGGSDEVQI